MRAPYPLDRAEARQIADRRKGALAQRGHARSEKAAAAAEKFATEREPMRGAPVAKASSECCSVSATGIMATRPAVEPPMRRSRRWPRQRGSRKSRSGQPPARRPAARKAPAFPCLARPCRRTIGHQTIDDCPQQPYAAAPGGRDHRHQCHDQFEHVRATTR